MSVDKTNSITHEYVTHYTEADRAAIREIFQLLPEAIPVSCRGSQHGGDPSDWDDHEKSKKPWLHSIAGTYKWKMERNVDNVRASLDKLVLVGIGLESARVFILDDDANPDTPPLEGLVGVPSRDPAHRHWIGRRGEGGFRDHDWRASERSGGEIKSRGQVVIWHPVEFLAAVKTLRHCAPITWEQVRGIGAVRHRADEQAKPKDADHPGPTFATAALARDAFKHPVPEGLRHNTMRAATASLIVRGIDPECLRKPFLDCFEGEELQRREADFDRAVKTAAGKLSSGEWLLRPVPKVEPSVTNARYRAAVKEARKRAVMPIETHGVRRYRGHPFPSSAPTLVRSQNEAAAAWLVDVSQQGRRIKYRHHAPGKDTTDRLSTGRFMEYFDGEGWVPVDLRAEVVDFCEATLVGNIRERDKHGNWQNRTRKLRKDGGSAEFSSGVMKLATKRRGVGIYEYETDADPKLLGIPGGVVYDMVAGANVAEPRDALVTRSTGVVPAAGCERFMEYLARRLPDDAVRERLLIETARTLIGVRLTKRVSWWIGPPNAFKSAYISCIRNALGDVQMGGYAGKMPSAYMVEGGETSIHKVDDQMGKLAGARVAVYDETPLHKGRPPVWSPRFVGELTDPDSGATGRELGARSVSLEGASFLCAANQLPTLPVSAAPAILARLILFRWEVTTPDPVEYAWLRSLEGRRECLRAVLDAMPLALRLGDDLPVPPGCAEALARYAETAA